MVKEFLSQKRVTYKEYDVSHSVGWQRELDPHPAARPPIALDCRSPSAEDREKLLLRQLVRDAGAAAACSEVDLVVHYTSATMGLESGE